MKWVGIVLLIVLFLSEAITLMSAIIHLQKTKPDTDKKTTAWGILSLVSIIVFFSVSSVGYFYQSAGVPQRGDNSAPFDPFDNGRIFKKVWESKRGNETLFSVVHFSLWHNDSTSWVKKDTLPEVFTRKQIVPDSVFVVLEDEFVQITSEQAYKILKMEIDEKQIKNFLGIKFSKKKMGFY